jgi:hypothetical protein
MSDIQKPYNQNPFKSVIAGENFLYHSICYHSNSLPYRPDLFFYIWWLRRDVTRIARVMKLVYSAPVSVEALPSQLNTDLTSCPETSNEMINLLLWYFLPHTFNSCKKVRIALVSFSFQLFLDYWPYHHNRRQIWTMRGRVDHIEPLSDDFPSRPTCWCIVLLPIKTVWSEVLNALTEDASILNNCKRFKFIALKKLGNKNYLS